MYKIYQKFPRNKAMKEKEINNLESELSVTSTFL